MLNYCKVDYRRGFSVCLSINDFFLSAKLPYISGMLSKVF